MGMTIDDSIRHIKDLRDARGCGYQQANIAIETMRKYQKIEQILKDIPYGGEATVRRIQEVMEDGNDNSIMDNSNL